MLSTPEAETPPQFYIAARSSPNDERTRVLKYGRMFAVFNRFGDIESGGMGEQGCSSKEHGFFQDLFSMSRIAIPCC
jgi:hypothetical protein